MLPNKSSKYVNRFTLNVYYCTRTIQALDYGRGGWEVVYIYFHNTAENNIKTNIPIEYTNIIYRKFTPYTNYALSKNQVKFT